MTLQLRRVILFTADVERLSEFYETVLGLPRLNSEPGWREFAAGGCSIALHQGKSTPGARPPKLAFFSADIAAARALLIARGASMGKLTESAFALCDGRDPDGNPFQISGRP